VIGAVPVISGRWRTTADVRLGLAEPAAVVRFPS
jgi:hypothetical protein